MKTELKNRTLYFDGTNQVDPDLVPDLFLHGVPPEKIVVDSLNDDIELFNLLSDVQILDSKLLNDSPNFTWNIPEQYSKIDLTEFVQSKVASLETRYKNRANEELVEIKERNLENLFKSLIYVVDSFRKNNIVWGVGRGSSCASLILFLIGIHVIDPVKYNIPLEEFFHD